MTMPRNRDPHHQQQLAGDHAVASATEAVMNFPYSLRKLDFFGYTPTASFTAYTTFLGTLATVLVFAIMGFYVATTLRSFVVSRPTVQQLFSPSPFAPLQLPDIAAAVALSSDNTPVVNPSMWTVSFKRYIIYQQYRGGRKSWEMPLADSCENVTREMGSETPRNFSTLYSCPSRGNMSFVKGQFNEDEYHYVAISVLMCDNKTSPVPCRPLPDILKALKDKSVIANIIQSDVSDTDHSQISKSVWSLKTDLLPTAGLVFYTETYLQNWSVTSLSRFVFDPQKNSDFVRIQSYERTLRDAAYTANPVVLWRMYLRVAPLTVTEYRSQRALLDMLGSWGALFGFLMHTIGFAAILIARRKFFRQLDRDDMPGYSAEMVHLRKYMFDSYGRLSGIGKEEVLRARQREQAEREQWYLEAKASNPEMFIKRRTREAIIRKQRDSRVGASEMTTPSSKAMDSTNISAETDGKGDAQKEESRRDRSESCTEATIVEMDGIAN